MRILIIGNGFLASPIIGKLLTEGHEILVYSRRESLKFHGHQIVGDIFDFAKFSKVLDWNPQIVINTAWITTPTKYLNDSSNYNYAQFTINLAKLLVNSNVEHLIVFGSCLELEFKDRLRSTQIQTSRSKSLYASQKIAALESCRTTLERASVRLTWARVFFPYGPHQHVDRLIPYLIHSIRAGDLIELKDTTSVNDWITIRDIASAVSWIIQNNLPIEVDVGTSLGHTNLEILTTLELLMSVESTRQKYESKSPEQNRNLIADKSSPLFTSGWLPADDLATGLNWILNS